jgi:biopolymer transport protein ExbD
MKFKIPIEGGDDEINMAPMIDMVFLLLIFFMVASHLTALERVPVVLPVADKAVVPKATRGRQLITIRAEDALKETATIYMNLQAVDIDQFATEIKKLHDADENLQVYLRADRFVKHRFVKAVMTACAEAGVVDIIFGTFESSGEAL